MKIYQGEGILLKRSKGKDPQIKADRFDREGNITRGKNFSRRSKVQETEPLDSFLPVLTRRVCLSPEEELKIGADLEVRINALWTHLLSYARSTEYVLTLLNAQFLKLPAGVDALSTAARSARSGKSKYKQKALEATASRLAKDFHLLDRDGLHLNAVISGLKNISTNPTFGLPKGQHLHFRRKSASYRQYVHDLQKKQKAANDIRQIFIESNLRLVITIARRFIGKGLPLSDLIQEGNIGLMKAVNRYDFRKGNRFSTYASYWIRQNIRRGIQEKTRDVRLPIHMNEKLQRVASARRSLCGTLGRAPSARELSVATGFSEDKLEELKTQTLHHTVSLDQPSGADFDNSLEEVFRPPEDDVHMSALEDLMRQENATNLMDCLEELSPREIDILKKRFAFNEDHCWTLLEIGKTYNLSRERIRQIQDKALDVLRRKLVKTLLKDEAA